MKKLLLSLIIGAIVCTSLPAYADCVYKGRSYPAGSKIGGLTCQADGSWR